MSIICSGSLAFDRLADYPGLFKDHILPDKIHMLNVCFLVDKVQRVHGGTAGNIAYNLYLLGEKPQIVTTIGGDPDGLDYLERIKGWGLGIENINISQDLPTPGAYIATDTENNQILFFNPGAMAQSTNFDPQNLPGERSSHLAIVSPGGMTDMKRLCKHYRELSIPFIFDPGQQVPAFSGAELLDMLDGSLMLMTNEYELDLFLKQTSLSPDDLYKYTSAVLTTLGQKGSRLATPRSTQHILPVPAEKVVNPTGAGDAYRAGVLKALANRESLLTACRLGSTVAAFSVEAPGTQEHSFTRGEVLARHFRAFKETISSLAS